LQAVPKRQATLTAQQERELRKLVERIEKAEAGLEEANDALDEFLRRDDVSIPAAARAMGLTPQALYLRRDRARK
jgi:hypothetical protein